MPDIAIHIENLSKQYRLGTIGTGTLSHDLKRWWTMNIQGKEDPNLRIGEVSDRSVKAGAEFVWALKDINLEIEQGDIVGIIGKNGAGKSTLLKILSRVTSPSIGTVRYRGRMASLLEVGTGFHWEMTGRENIFMNGSIMGMTKAEIKRKLDEIVAFAGVEKYIDTPVKRYSSGMIVRLGFSVAAHLEPEILIVDEVLAVGDAEFQKKAIGKMQDVSKGQGRTVLFVSHNMASIKTLCSKAAVLENGCLTMITDSEAAVGYYLKGNIQGEHRKRFGGEYQTKEIEVEEVAVKAKGKTYQEPITEADEIEIHTQIKFDNETHGRFHITYHIHSEPGDALFSFSTYNKNVHFTGGSNQIIATAPKGFFLAGAFYLTLFVVKDHQYVVFMQRDIMQFTVVDSKRQLGAYMGREPGFIAPEFEWKLGKSKVSPLQ